MCGGMQGQLPIQKFQQDALLVENAEEGHSTMCM